MGLKTMVGGRRTRGAATADVDTIRRPSTIISHKKRAALVMRPEVEEGKSKGGKPYLNSIQNEWPL